METLARPGRALVEATIFFVKRWNCPVAKLDLSKLNPIGSGIRNFSLAPPGRALVEATIFCRHKKKDLCASVVVDARSKKKQ